MNCCCARFLLRMLRAGIVQVSGRLDDDSSPKRQRQASGKRQGTKSRDVGHPTLQQLLWGIRRVDAGRERGEEAFCWAVEM
jgi:hypothetical protein